MSAERNEDQGSYLLYGGRAATSLPDEQEDMGDCVDPICLADRFRYWVSRIHWGLVSLNVAGAFGMGVVALPLLFSLAGRFLGTILLIINGLLTWKVLCGQVISVTSHNIQQKRLQQQQGGVVAPSSTGSPTGSSAVLMPTNTLSENETSQVNAFEPTVLASFNDVAAHTIAKPAAYIIDLSVFCSVQLALVFAALIIVGCLTDALEQMTGIASASALSSESWFSSQMGLVVLVTFVASLWSLKPNLLDHTIANACAGVTVLFLIAVLALVLALGDHDGDAIIVGIDGNHTISANSSNSSPSSFPDGQSNNGSDGGYTGPFPTSWIHLLQALPVFIGAFSLSYNTPTLVGEVAQRSYNTLMKKHNSENDGDKKPLSTTTSPLAYSIAHLEDTRDRCVASITVSILFIATCDLILGLLATSALTYESVMSGDGSVLASLPKPLHGSIGGGSSGMLMYVSTVTIRLLVALHVTSIFPVFATTARQAFLRVMLKVRESCVTQHDESEGSSNTTVPTCQWSVQSVLLHIPLALSMGAIVVYLCDKADGVGMVLGLNSSIFAPGIALFCPAYSTWWLLHKNCPDRRQGEEETRNGYDDQEGETNVQRVKNNAAEDLRAQRVTTPTVHAIFVIILGIYCAFVTISGVVSWSG